VATTTKESALVIPLTAYTSEDDSIYVYVLEQKPKDLTTFAEGGMEAKPGIEQPDMYLLKRREVEIGIITVNQVEVVSGLAEDELLAIGNQSMFREDLEGRLGEEK
jgi:hypothetical protein